MDSTEEEVHFNKSVFKNLDPRFFCKSIAANHIKPILGIVRLDFWHICKYGWLACAFGAMVVFKLQHQWWVHYISLWAIWFFTFELFYGKILKVK